ncbi:hypothetical protein DUNSADRAFT_11706, partial [Dunaliella salina]
IDEGEKCQGQCYPVVRNLTSAAFANSGRAILVGLSAQANDLERPCSDVFDSQTMARLASSGCSVRENSRSTLHIELSADATIMPGNTLSLKENNGLRAFLVANEGVNATFDASGSVEVASCNDCQKPTARITDSPSQVFFEGIRFLGSKHFTRDSSCVLNSNANKQNIPKKVDSC